MVERLDPVAISQTADDREGPVRAPCCCKERLPVTGCPAGGDDVASVSGDRGHVPAVARNERIRNVPEPLDGQPVELRVVCALSLSEHVAESEHASRGGSYDEPELPRLPSALGWPADEIEDHYSPSRPWSERLEENHPGGAAVGVVDCDHSEPSTDYVD